MVDANKGVWNMSRWKFILEFILMVPAYFPSCCAPAGVPLDLSILSSEELGNPCACLTEFVASGVLQEIPSSIRAPLMSTFQPFTVQSSYIICGLGSLLSFSKGCNYQSPSLVWRWLLATLSSVSGGMHCRMQHVRPSSKLLFLLRGL